MLAVESAVSLQTPRTKLRRLAALAGIALLAPAVAFLIAEAFPPFGLAAGALAAAVGAWGAFRPFSRPLTVTRARAISLLWFALWCLAASGAVNANNVERLKAEAPDKYLEQIKRSRSDAEWLSALSELRPDLYAQEVARREAKKQQEQVSSDLGSGGAADLDLYALVTRVEVGSQKIEITFRKAAIGIEFDVLQRRLGEADQISDAQDAYVIVAPIRLRAWGGETVLEGPNGGSAVTAVHFDHTLIDALVQAMAWRDQLSSGEVRRIEQIARRENRDESRVRHLLPLAFLAPDIVERILVGRQPRHVTLDRLLRMDLPVKWIDQRAVLGMGGATR